MGVQNFAGGREVMPLCPITEAKQNFDLPSLKSTRSAACLIRLIITIIRFFLKEMHLGGFIVFNP